MKDNRLDRIFIRGLRFSCIIGVHPEERRKKQDVVVDITLYLDLRNAGITDSLESSVDYQALEKTILQEGAASKFFLIEGLAEYIAGICLEYPLVRQVKIVLEKPAGASCARSVGVEILRKNPDQP